LIARRALSRESRSAICASPWNPIGGPIRLSLRPTDRRAIAAHRLRSRFSCKAASRRSTSIAWVRASRQIRR
jgi:hypothetical protein